MKVVAMGSTHGMGGLQTHFRLLVDFLLREKHEVGVISVGDIRLYPPSKVAFSHTLPHSAESVGAMLEKAIVLWRARSDARRFAPDLFIGTASGKAYVAVANAVPQKTFKIHQEVCTDTTSDGKNWVRMAQCFDAVAAQSLSVAAACRNQLVDERPVGILPCFAEPLNCDDDSPPPRQDGALRFCYFGRLAANKGLAEFVSSFAKVAQAIDATFDIHGSGPEAQRLQDLVHRLDLQDRIKMCGPYPSEGYCRLLRSYHCMVLPSREFEGLPLVLIEAMSCGVPFLATRVGAIPDAAINNDDVLLMSADEDGMILGLREVAVRLRQGLFSRERLMEYYRRNFSPSVVEEFWREMLHAPMEYFA